MKLWYSPASPFVRKVRVTAQETGLADKIEILETNTNVVQSDSNLRKANPLGKIPALELETGQVLYDSRVICAYLAARDSSGRLVPTDETERFRSMTLEALSDGIMDAAVNTRYELALRPEKYRWNDWVEGQLLKVNTGLDSLESDWIDMLESRQTIGAIATGCALGYLDFRFGDLGWRASRPRLGNWFEAFGKLPSMRSTTPPT